MRPAPIVLPVLLAAAFVGMAGRPGGCAEDDVALVARVGGQAIGRARFEAQSRRTKVAAVAEGPQRMQAEAALLERLVDEVLLGQAAAKEGVEADPAAVDAEIERLRGQVAGRGEEAIEECLTRAAAIRRRILEGELTFAAAARAHSAGPSRRRDGDVGSMPRRSSAHEEFARQAFSLAKGDISPPFVTPFGVHIVQVTDMQPGERTLVSLRPQIEQLLAQQVVRDAVAEMRRGTPVEYSPGVAHFDPATPAEGSQPRRVVVAGQP